ncbi:hypothetical protein [Bradyrhizobium sp.]|uniref:hypothetical protein n=1 Tax=Bradyrhizobium sp. TaxID=376 RepID=UPI002638F93F|nr:hypothetical protein [Bradyrhizobium sp.]
MRTSSHKQSDVDLSALSQLSAAALQIVVRDRLAAFGDPWPPACRGDLLLRLANATRDARIVWWRAIKAAA